MRKIRNIIIALIALSLLVACVPIILPSSAGSKAAEGFVELAIVALALSCFAIVAAVLFMLGLQSFKNEFKKTYYFMCAGLITQAVALLVYPTAIYLDILGTGFTSYGGDLFYTIGAVLIFIGLRQFARLLKLSTRLSTFWFVGGVTGVLSVALWALPHGPITGSELQFDLTRNIVSFEAILSIMCVTLLWKIRRQASLFYSRPILWLMYALFFNGIGDACYFAANHFLTPEGAPNSNLTSLSGIVFLVSRTFYIVAGYSLIRMTRKEEVRQENVGPIDVIIYLASLASRPTDIDPVLDKLRLITANLPASKQPTAVQIDSLQDVYYQLQDYLVNKEPLLKYSKESIQAKLEHKFGSIPFAPAKN